MNKVEAVKQDMRKSMNVVQLVKPLLFEVLPHRDLIYNLYPVEGNDDEICKKLDLTCGIDYILEMNYKNGTTIMYGVGCRVQWLERDGRKYHSFTIRKKRESGAPTELEKRIEAKKHDGIYPQLTLHIYAYKDTNEIESFAITKTDNVIKFIQDEFAGTNETGKDKIGQSEFWIIYWSDFKKLYKDKKIYGYIKGVIDGNVF